MAKLMSLRRQTQVQDSSNKTGPKNLLRLTGKKVVARGTSVKGKKPTTAKVKTPKAYELPKWESDLTFTALPVKHQDAEGWMTLITPADYIRSTSAPVMNVTGDEGFQRDNVPSHVKDYQKEVQSLIDDESIREFRTLTVNAPEFQWDPENFELTIPAGNMMDIVDGYHAWTVYNNIRRSMMESRDEEDKDRKNVFLEETHIPLLVLANWDEDSLVDQFVKMNAKPKAISTSHFETIQGERGLLDPVKQASYQIAKQLARNPKSPMFDKVTFKSKPDKEHKLSIRTLRKMITDIYRPVKEETDEVYQQIVDLWRPMVEAFPEDNRLYSNHIFWAIFRMKDELSPSNIKKLQRALGADGLNAFKGYTGSGAGAQSVQNIIRAAIKGQDISGMIHTDPTEEVEEMDEEVEASTEAKTTAPIRRTIRTRTSLTRK